jgi:hypothetical protein
MELCPTCGYVLYLLHKPLIMQWSNLAALMQLLHNQRLEGKYFLQVDEVVNISEAAKDRWVVVLL